MLKKIKKKEMENVKENKEKRNEQIVSKLM